MSGYQFTIIVPVYNEEDNLERVEKEFSAFFEKALIKSKALFVNDGSKGELRNFSNNFRRMFTDDGVEDTGCLMNVIQTDCVKSIPMFKGLHRFLLVMIQHQSIINISIIL